MTDEEIIENNKLIAEFMGYDVKKADKGFLIRYKDGKYSGEFATNGNSYHESWDWLMPVVDKIDEILIIHDGRTFIEGMSNDGKLRWWCNLDRSYAESTVSKIDAVYKAVLEFIKWYNKNKYEETKE